MPRAFWAQCPKCDESFQAHYDELRNSGIKLLCPTCGHRFLDSEAKSITE
ncbi:MJ0042-type zinc finger domain-containing protein [Haloarchaeobius litoreus]|uniref:MJ0042-type zinc finger domain-containing protein n=1 Tax=Haloarchaeobius litoreus TaxID=755306 RepID=A0ABD6DQU3_9EURY|nr:MJ0042-type zinc finger domain-containing protein [Haloarchaeobius litoreus]